MKKYGDYSLTPQKIGSGAFGDIYLGTNSKRENVALKIEKNTRNSQLNYEFKVLQILDHDGRANERGILKVYDFFKDGDENVMVMKVLGESLETLFKRFNKIFDSKSILMIGLEILDRI
jgi:serine/threonine protein kinase